MALQLPVKPVLHHPGAIGAGIADGCQPKFRTLRAGLGSKTASPVAGVSLFGDRGSRFPSSRSMLVKSVSRFIAMSGIQGAVRSRERPLALVSPLLEYPARLGEVRQHGATLRRAVVVRVVFRGVPDPLDPGNEIVGVFR